LVTRRRATPRYPAFETREKGGGPDFTFRGSV
jgi:hypothetical protein